VSYRGTDVVQVHDAESLVAQSLDIRGLVSDAALADALEARVFLLRRLAA
jgi:hypothetical protein